jgi:hypothetical protein
LNTSSSVASGDGVAIMYFRDGAAEGYCGRDDGNKA